MNILALDTADQVFSTALSTDSGFWYREADAGAKHSELLMECVDELFRASGISPKQLQLVACMKGPGSFTGLRIGLSSAKGLALALGIPIISIPTLDCLAYSLLFWPGLVIPAIDAKKGCFYTALYRGNRRLCDYMDAAPELIAELAAKALLSENEPVILTGSGSDLLFPFMVSRFPDLKQDEFPGRGRARELLKIAKCAKLAEYGDPASVPLYLRKSDAELKHE